MEVIRDGQKGKVKFVEEVEIVNSEITTSNERYHAVFMIPVSILVVSVWDHSLPTILP